MWRCLILSLVFQVQANHPDCGKDPTRRGSPLGSRHKRDDSSATSGPTSTHEQAWSVAIVLPRNDGSNGTKLHCSGSILDEKTILTAAQCFVGKFAEDLSKMTI